MAPKKITAFTANTTPQPTDITVMVDDPGGSPLTQKITLANLLAVTNALTEDTSPDTTADLVPVYDTSAAAMKKVLLSNILRQVTDWVPVTGAWSYASANTITVPSGAASIYKKGMGVRIKQGGGYKYYYITIVADALLTVTGGTDYTVANAAITDVAYTTSPKTAVGFPVSFNAAFPTWTLSTVDNGAGGQPSSTSATSYFMIDGNFCTYAVVMGNNNATKVSTNNQIQFAIPATLPTPSDGILMPGGVAYTVANSAGVIGISLANGSNVDLRFNGNITDNYTVPYTGCKITYKY